MKKGVQGEENGIKFKVLDSRQKGSGTEVDIEIVEQGARGNGLLKLYGPNKSKEYVVMVSKSKGSDNKFVTILAQKVVKPLMKKYLLMDDSKTEEVEKKPAVEENPFKCHICEKTLNSSPGLKGHMTKMHKIFKKIENNEQNHDIENKS